MNTGVMIFFNIVWFCSILVQRQQRYRRSEEKWSCMMEIVIFICVFNNFYDDLMKQKLFFTLKLVSIRRVIS